MRTDLTSFWARAPLARYVLLPSCLPCQLLQDNLIVRAGRSSPDRAVHAQVYKALRNNVQDCAVKRLRNVNKTELANFQRVRNSPLEAFKYAVSVCETMTLLCCFVKQCQLKAL